MDVCHSLAARNTIAIRKGTSGAEVLKDALTRILGADCRDIIHDKPDAKNTLFHIASYYIFAHRDS